VRAIEARVEIRGASVASTAEWELLAGAADARNSFSTPEAIVPRRTTLPAGRTFRVRLPAGSVSVVSVDIGAR
jgi:alpha-L-arabinofuranosidase